MQTGSARVVPIVVAPPDSRLVAAEWCAVEPLVHSPEAVEAARVGRVRVVDHAVLERERAHSWPLARVGVRPGARLRRDLGDGRVAAHRLPLLLAPVVVLDPPVALLPFGEVRVEEI